MELIASAFTSALVRPCSCSAYQTRWRYRGICAGIRHEPRVEHPLVANSGAQNSRGSQRILRRPSQRSVGGVMSISISHEELATLEAQNNIWKEETLSLRKKLDHVVITETTQNTGLISVIVFQERQLREQLESQVMIALLLGWHDVLALRMVIWCRWHGWRSSTTPYRRDMIGTSMRRS
jgi:hypothetical protein